MSFFDSIKKAFDPQTQNSRNAETPNKNKTETFTFVSIPADLSTLQSLPEASLDSPFKTAALSVLALCLYETNQDILFEMLDFLNGPEPVSVYTKQFLNDRLRGKTYLPFSFFRGATPENGYKPDQPFTITVSENPYTYSEDGLWATVYVKSGGADSPRPIKLRKKPSTGQWFLNELQCLSEIRIPVSEDPWA